jgi:hypothetical protein
MVLDFHYHEALTEVSLQESRKFTVQPLMVVYVCTWSVTQCLHLRVYIHRGSGPHDVICVLQTIHEIHYRINEMMIFGWINLSIF